MDTLNQLIKMGFEFHTTASGGIGYELVGTNPINEEKAAALFERLKADKSASVEYIRTIIKVVVDVKAGDETGGFIFDVFDCNGRKLFSHNTDEPTDYFNNEFANNQRYIKVAAFYKKLTGILRFFVSDTEAGGATSGLYRFVETKVSREEEADILTLFGGT